MNRFDELASEYLDGAIDAAGREELARLLDADPARMGLLAELVREDRILSAVIAGPGEDEFARGVMADLQKDRTRFVRAVMTDVRPGDGGDDSRAPQRARPSLPAKRRPGPRAGPGPAWMAWSAAAAAAVLLILLVLSGGGDDPSRRDRRPAKEQPIAEREKTPPKNERRDQIPPAPMPEAPRARTPETPRALHGKPPVPDETPKPEAPEPEPRAPKPPVEKRPEEKPTVVEVATLDRAEGGVLVERGDARRPARAGEALLAGDALEAPGYAGRATVKYGDGTTIMIEGDALLRIPAQDVGKRLALERGILRAQVAKQPPAQPMAVATPHGDAIVVGTTLRIVVGPDPKEGTRLEVEEGKVRLQRKADGKSVDVPAGHYAVAAAGVPLSSRFARVTAGLAALYTFKESRGAVVRDVSRAGEPLDLRIENESAARWTSKGLALTAPTLVASSAPASRIVKACKATNEVTVEAWVRPAVLAPANKDGRLVALSADPMGQNFMLGQDELKGPTRSYFMRLRTTTTDLVGKPALASPDGTVALRATHVVYARSASGAAALYVDGVEVARSTVAGTLATWNESYRLGLGNELTNDRPWLGEFQLAAVYARALGADEIKKNLRAGAE